MSFTVGGSTPQLTFADATVQNTAALPLTGGSVSADITVNGLTVGRGGGSVSTNTAVGASALNANTSGANNTSIGTNSGLLITTGSQNTSIGSYSGNTNLTGSYNTFVGYSSGNGNGGSHSENVGVGASSFASITTGGQNVAIGRQALALNTTASNNTAVGYQSGYTQSTNGQNTFMGYQSGYSTTSGAYNVAMGSGSLYSAAGSYNVAIGYNAGYNATSASNTFIGQGAGYYVTSGAKNTVIGNYNGNQGGLDIRTASNYIVLSDGDGNPQVQMDSSAHMTIGASGTNSAIRMPSTGGTIYIASITSNSQFQISYNSISAGVALASGATSWSTFSDNRLKNVTGTYTNALADIAQIQPVKFTWKNDSENKPQVGVIAQSVQNVVPEAIDSTTYEMGGDTEYLQVRYTELIPLMIASIQQLKAEFDAYKATHP